MACGGIIFIYKKNQILEKKIFHFVLFNLIFFCYYCSINLIRQSEHSGLFPDTSSLVFSITQLSTNHFFRHSPISTVKSFGKRNYG